MPDLKGRLLAKISRSEAGCWIWTGAQNSNGYGVIRVNGKLFAAHRASYLAFNGPLLSNLFVCHACDTPLCVNPKHLWLGTAADNAADCIAKGRRFRPSGPYVRAEYKPRKAYRKPIPLSLMPYRTLSRLMDEAARKRHCVQPINDRIAHRLVHYWDGRCPIEIKLLRAIEQIAWANVRLF